MTAREQLLDKCYMCFVRNGIENTSIRDFCNAAEVNSNTLYYYFNSKYNIFVECVNYGYRKLENALIGALDSHYDSASFDIFPLLAKIGLDYAPEIRFLHQAVSSPAYEEHRDCQFKKVNAFHDMLGKELASRFGCPYEIIKDYVYEIMTLISYFSLWGSRDMAAIQFSRVFSDLQNAVTNYKKISGALD